MSLDQHVPAARIRRHQATRHSTLIPKSIVPEVPRHPRPSHSRSASFRGPKCGRTYRDSGREGDANTAFDDRIPLAASAVRGDEDLDSVLF